MFIFIINNTIHSCKIHLIISLIIYKKIIYSHENYEKIQLTSIPYNIEHVREYSSYEKNMKLVVEGYKRLVHLNKE